MQRFLYSSWLFKSQVKMFYIVLLILVCCTYCVVMGECPTGAYFDKHVIICKNCSTCKPGSEVYSECEKYADRRCKPCLQNFFSTDGISCRPCSHCPVGARTALQCNSTMDTVCVVPTTTESSLTSAIGHVQSTNPEKTKPYTLEPTVKTPEESMKYIIITLSILGTLIVLAVAVIVWLCVVQRKRKRRSDSLSVEMSDLSGSVNVMQVKPYTEFLADLKDRDISMSEVTSDLYEVLGHVLNPGGWRMLAGKLGFTMQEANYFALESSRALQDMLARWAIKKGSTLYVLALCLYQMGREDCLREIEEYWKQNRTTNV